MAGDPLTGDDEIPDSSLARERTELAWSRSGLAVAVTIAIIVRRLWPLSDGAAILALALTALGATTWTIAMRLGRRPRAWNNALGSSAFGALTAGTIILAVGAFVVSLI